MGCGHEVEHLVKNLVENFWADSPDPLPIHEEMGVVDAP